MNRNPENVSYVWPYTLIGGTVGLLLSYLSNNPIFGIAGTSLGIGYGMIRNNNIKTNKCERNHISTIIGGGLKIVTLYILGPTLIGACGIFILLLCMK